MADVQRTSPLRSCYVEGQMLDVRSTGWAPGAEVYTDSEAEAGDAFQADDAGVLTARLPIVVRGHGEKILPVTFSGRVLTIPTLRPGARVSYDRNAWGAPGASFSDDVADGQGRLYWFQDQSASGPTFYRYMSDGGRHFWSSDGWEWDSDANGNRTRAPYASQGKLLVRAKVSSRSVAILPGKARSTQRVRFEARGFTAKPLYAHYVQRRAVVRRGGRRVVQRARALRTIRMGTPRGACGVLNTKARILPFKWPLARGPKQQVLDVQYDHSRRYRARSTGVVDRSELVVRRSGRGYTVSAGAPNRL